MSFLKCMAEAFQNRCNQIVSAIISAHLVALHCTFSGSWIIFHCHTNKIYAVAFISGVQLPRLHAFYSLCSFTFNIRYHDVQPCRNTSREIGLQWIPMKLEVKVVTSTFI